MKYHIMQLVLSLEIGGLERFVVNFAHALDKDRFSVSVCALQPGGVLADILTSDSVKVFTVPRRPGVDWSLPARLARLIAVEKIDLVHTHNPAPWLYGCLGARLGGARAVVHTEHSHLALTQKKLLFAERMVAGATNRVVCDASSVRDFMINTGIARTKITTIFNGIDMDTFKVPADRVALRRELKIPVDHKVLGCVARLESVKNHEFLLESLAGELVSRQDVTLVLVVMGANVNFCKLRLTAWVSATRSSLWVRVLMFPGF